MERAVDAGTLASALCWAGGAPIPIVEVDTIELSACTSARVPISASVHARPRELSIQIDTPGVHPHAVRVARDTSNTLHVLVDRPGDVGPAYRRFDFAGAYDASRARAWMRYGIVTIRVPASKRPPWAGCPNIADSRDALAPLGTAAGASPRSMRERPAVPDETFDGSGSRSHRSWNAGPPDCSHDRSSDTEELLATKLC